MIRERWLEHDQVRLHYLQADGDPRLTPLAYHPGSLGNAEDFRDEMRRLAPRPTVALSPRGLGRSDAPERGYSLAHRTGDLAALLDHLALPPTCLMAFSLGVPIVLDYAVRHPERVAGLILLDSPARFRVRSQSWLEQALPFARERGIPEHVVHRLKEESEPTELWDELSVLRCPVLIVKGGQSLHLTDDDLAQYRAALPQARIEVFEDAGHEVFRPDYERFMQAVEHFLESLD